MVLSLAQALQQAKQQGIELLDAQLLLLQAVGQDTHNRVWLITQQEQVLTELQQSTFTQLCQQRLAGVPVAYLLGVKEFFGLQFKVTPQVLIPRPDTETLVEWALEYLTKIKVAQPLVADLGTGSGAIACAIKDNYPAAELWATDASSGALQVAQDNAEQLNLIINFAQGSWCQALPTKAKFNLIVSNPPYIAEQDEHLADLKYEPLSALVAMDNGLADIQQIAWQARQHLAQTGVLMFEHGYNQAAQVAKILADLDYQQIEHRCDLAGIVRCTLAVFKL